MGLFAGKLLLCWLQMLKTHQVKVEYLEYNVLDEEWKKQLAQDFEAMQNTLKGKKKVRGVVLWTPQTPIVYFILD